MHNAHLLSLSNVYMYTCACDVPLIAFKVLPTQCSFQNYRTLYCMDEWCAIVVPLSEAQNNLEWALITDISCNVLSEHSHSELPFRNMF